MKAIPEDTFLFRKSFLPKVPQFLFILHDMSLLIKINQEKIAKNTLFLDDGNSSIIGKLRETLCEESVGSQFFWRLEEGMGTSCDFLCINKLEVCITFIGRAYRTSAYIPTLASPGGFCRL